MNKSAVVEVVVGCIKQRQKIDNKHHERKCIKRLDKKSIETRKKSCSGEPVTILPEELSTGSARSLNSGSFGSLRMLQEQEQILALRESPYQR